MQTVDPEPMPHQSRWRANWLTAILALIAFLGLHHSIAFTSKSEDSGRLIVSLGIAV